MTRLFLFGLFIGAIALPFSGAKAETQWHIVTETCIQMTCKSNATRNKVLFDNSKDCMKAAGYVSDRATRRVHQLARDGKIDMLAPAHITTTCRPSVGS